MTKLIDTNISEIASGIRKVSDISALAAAVANGTARSSQLAARAAALSSGLITAHEFVEDFSEREFAGAGTYLAGSFTNVRHYVADTCQTACHRDARPAR